MLMKLTAMVSVKKMAMMMMVVMIVTTVAMMAHLLPVKTVLQSWEWRMGLKKVKLSVEL